MLLESRDMVVSYGDSRVVDGVSVGVDAGEIVSLIGPNGSGKSTILKALNGRLTPSAGTVLIDGDDARTWSSRRRAQTIGMLNQVNSAPPDMTVRELVGYGRHPHRRWYERSTRDDEEAVDWAIAHTELESFADRAVTRLSGGEAQRAWLAMVLAQRPRVLLLDEPTTYLDIAHQHEVLEVVTSLNRSLGIAVLMVLHDLGQAAAFSDRVITLEAGRVVADGSPTAVLTPDLIRAVYGMNAEVTPDPANGRPRIHLLRHRPDAAVPRPEEKTL